MRDVGAQNRADMAREMASMSSIGDASPNGDYSTNRIQPSLRHGKRGYLHSLWKKARETQEKPWMEPALPFRTLRNRQAAHLRSRKREERAATADFARPRRQLRYDLIAALEQAVKARAYVPKLQWF